MPDCHGDGFVQFKVANVVPKVSAGRTSSFNISKHTWAALMGHGTWKKLLTAVIALAIRR
jgi:hypothetical protein